MNTPIIYYIALVRASGAMKEIFSNESEEIVRKIYHNQLDQLIQEKRIKSRDNDQYIFQSRKSSEKLTF